MKIGKFIETLQKEPCSYTIHNPYKNDILANNLGIYLRRMSELKPSIMLVGEAPGHRGCALTGIPFTDEKHMMSNNANGILGEQFGYRCISNTGSHMKENSATVIWDMLNKIESNDKIPILWNIFPFHPHENNDTSSNRAPTQDETDLGTGFLRALLDIFPSIQRIYAIGRIAEGKLLRCGFISERDRSYIRHPSHGGNAECRKRLNDILLKE